VRAFKLNIIIFFALVFFFAACTDDNANKGKPHGKSAAESLVKANRYLVKQEKEAIENYIGRHNWQMQETGSGLRYAIVEKGKGEKAVQGKVAVLQYSTRLITGDLVYSSAKDGLKIFVIGHGGVESGLEEALLLMHQGDKARLIIPSHLAFGLLGDDDKIPPRATVVYELELIELK
jgi:FKBP-type peptidyl-prolyl cis-trans isomerase